MKLLNFEKRDNFFYYQNEPIAYDVDEIWGELLTSIANICIKINPKNPKAVADNIQKMINIIKEASKLEHGRPAIKDCNCITCKAKTILRRIKSKI